MDSNRVSYPLILVNLKTYKEAMGENGVRLAKTAEKVSRETGVCISVSPQTVDLRQVATSADIPVFAQHIDPVTYGKYTGHTLAEAIKEAGCIGTLISHSERRLDLETVKETIDNAKEANLLQMVCADTVKRGREIAPFNPDAIAVEPPELIGTGISVSKSRPEIVSDSVKAIHEVNGRVRVLCGAGISSGEDVEAALKLGAEGILVASGVVKAPSQHDKLMELAQAMGP